MKYLELFKQLLWRNIFSNACEAPKKNLIKSDLISWQAVLKFPANREYYGRIDKLSPLDKTNTL